MSKPLNVEPTRSSGKSTFFSVFRTSRHAQPPRDRQPSRARHSFLSGFGVKDWKVQIVFEQSYLTVADAVVASWRARSATRTRSVTFERSSSRDSDADANGPGALRRSRFAAMASWCAAAASKRLSVASGGATCDGHWP